MNPFWVTAPDPVTDAVADLAEAAGLNPTATTMPGMARCAVGGSGNARTDVVGVYAIGVREQFRGRGLGAAITAPVLAAGRDLGCSIGVLQASPMGDPVYRCNPLLAHARLVRVLVVIAGSEPGGAGPWA